MADPEQWDRRFASIMKDTELSLAKVKSQLHSPVAARRLQLLGSPPRRPHTVSTGRLRRSGRQVAGARRVSFNSSLPASVISRGLANASTLELEGGGRGGLEGGRSGGLESLKGAVRDGRTEQLQREMATLRGMVTSLQSTVHEQSQQIRILKGEVSHLRGKVRESGADRKSERKLEEFKMEVSRELNLLRKQHGSSSLSHPASQDHTFLSSIAQELHSSKRMWSEDLECLQRDLTLLNSRMVSQESEMTELASSLRDMESRHALSSVEECRRSEVRKSWELDSAHQHTAQMHAIRHSLSSLEQRLTTLEQRLLEELSLVQRGDDDLLVPSTVGALSQGLEGEDEGVRGDGGKRNPLMGRVELRGGRGEGWSSMLDLSEDLDSLSDSEAGLGLSDSLLLEDSGSTTSLDTTLSL